MTDEPIPEWARVLIDAAPPLTGRQVEVIRNAVANPADPHPVDVRQPVHRRHEAA